MENFAVVGTGLIGRAWAMVFARAGHPVTLYDIDSAAAERALAIIERSLIDLDNHGLLNDAVANIRARIRIVPTLAETLREADYVQENASENLALKQSLYVEMDRLAPAHAVLASSTSFIPTSQFSASVTGRHRCVVAHPVNPPHLVPVVEISGAPWTSRDTIERTRELQEKVGQTTVIVEREIPGFILNRLQSVLMAEAFRLVEGGYCSMDDLDKCLKDGLALRWSFMGPYETVDLNAPGGLSDYVQRFGNTMMALDASAESTPRELSSEFFQRADAERRRKLPMANKETREAWRARSLMALPTHKREMQQKDGG